MQAETRSSRAPMTTRLLGISALAAGLLATQAAAVDVDHLEIRTSKGSYEVDMTFSVAAAPARVVTVLTDFGYPDKLNRDVTARQVLGVRDGLTRVRTEFRGCALFLCEDITLVQDVAVTENTVVADVVAGQGDFTSGRLEWRITANETGGARVEFRANMEYDFFVLPVFGRLMLRNRLKQQLLETAENLETEVSRRID